MNGNIVYGLYVRQCVQYVRVCVQQQHAQQKPVVQQHIAQQNYLQPSFAVYKGSSLPNVSQIASNSIDLQVLFIAAEC